MRIRWIVSAANVDPRSAELASDLASYRYRAAIPLHALRLRGHACDWHALRPGEVAGDALLDIDALVFAKNHTEPAEVLALLDEACRRGVATIVDVCDDYFSIAHPLARHYRELVARADRVTTSSFHLAAAIEDATDAPADIVRDPYEGPQGTPRWAPDASNMRALWFGTPFNLPALLDEAAALPQRIDGFRLDVAAMTRRCEGLDNVFEKLNARGAGKLALRFREWSLEGNWGELRACDVVLLPIKTEDRFSAAKGPNRLVEALRAGRYAVTGALAAYDEFKPYASVGEDAAGAIAWALRRPDEVLERIAAGQDYVARRYSPDAIAAEWEAVLASATRRAP